MQRAALATHQHRALAAFRQQVDEHLVCQHVQLLLVLALQGRRTVSTRARSRAGKPRTRWGTCTFADPAMPSTPASPACTAP